MNWSQSKIPFNDDFKSYVSRIDIDKDSLLLQKELGIRTECIRTMKITTFLLKKCVSLNLSLYDIGLLICRRTPDCPSILEKIYQTSILKLNSNRVEPQQTSFDKINLSIDEENLLLEIFNSLMNSIIQNNYVNKRRTTL